MEYEWNDEASCNIPFTTLQDILAVFLRRFMTIISEHCGTRQTDDPQKSKQREYRREDHR